MPTTDGSEKAIMKAAEKVYVLADSSKFGGGYLSVICPTNEVDKIITDDGVSKRISRRQKNWMYRWLSRNRRGTDGKTAESL